MRGSNEAILGSLLICLFFRRDFKTKDSEIAAGSEQRGERVIRAARGSPGAAGSARPQQPPPHGSGRCPLPLPSRPRFPGRTRALPAALFPHTAWAVSRQAGQGRNVALPPPAARTVPSRPVPSRCPPRSAPSLCPARPRTALAGAARTAPSLCPAPSRPAARPARPRTGAGLRLRPRSFAVSHPAGPAALAADSEFMPESPGASGAAQAWESSLGSLPGWDTGAEDAVQDLT